LIQHDDDPSCSMPGRRGSVDAPRGSPALYIAITNDEVGKVRTCHQKWQRCVQQREDIRASRKDTTTGKCTGIWRLRYRKAERSYGLSCRRVGATALGPAGDRQCGWVEFECRRSRDTCLTAQWNLLDTDSIAEEFDGSWKVDATAGAIRANRRKRSMWAPLRENAHRQTRRATQVPPA
jgi:hypothetical protein